MNTNELPETPKPLQLNQINLGPVIEVIDEYLNYQKENEDENTNRIC